MFWHLVALLIGQVPQVYRWPQISTDERLDKKRVFHEKLECDWSQLFLMGERSQADNLFLESFWVANVKDESDTGWPFQTKAEFSYDVAVMDKIGGWEEGE